MTTPATNLVKENQSLFGGSSSHPNTNSISNSILLMPLPASANCSNVSVGSNTAGGSAPAVHPTTLALYKNINAHTTKSVATAAGRSSFNDKHLQQHSGENSIHHANNVSITNELLANISMTAAAAPSAFCYEPTVLTSVAVPFR
jgi:hypothetical protein